MFNTEDLSWLFFELSRNVMPMLPRGGEEFAGVVDDVEGVAVSPTFPPPLPP